MTKNRFFKSSLFCDAREKDEKKETKTMSTEKRRKKKRERVLCLQREHHGSKWMKFEEDLLELLFHTSEEPCLADPTNRKSTLCCQSPKDFRCPHTARGRRKHQLFRMLPIEEAIKTRRRKRVKKSNKKKRKREGKIITEEKKKH